MSKTPVTKASYDMCTESYRNVWEAHGGIVAEAHMTDADIVSVRLVGVAPHGWPTLEVEFASRAAAEAYTCVYLGMAEDGEVAEYLAAG